MINKYNLTIITLEAVNGNRTHRHDHVDDVDTEAGTLVLTTGKSQDCYPLANVKFFSVAEVECE